MAVVMGLLEAFVFVFTDMHSVCIAIATCVRMVN